MDPISIASGAAGLLSLGITVCQSLLNYYGSIKDAPENVAKTYTSIEGLSKTLELLKITTEFKAFNGQIVNQVQDSITSAEQSIRNLQKKLDKVQVVALPDDWRDKAKAQLRRTLYPLKESTLAKLRELSSETRDNLSVALDLLQIDASATSLKKLDLLSHQAANVSTNVDFLRQQSTSISANVHDIAGSTKETAKLIDSLAFNKRSKGLRAWLSGDFDPTPKQDDTWKERQPGTGQWFLSSHEFQAWLEKPAQQTPRVLNIIGKSGAGKTSLMSSTIRAAQSLGRDSSQTAVAYFYCSFDEAASQDPINMVGSFLSQVSTVCPNILEGLEVGFTRRERPNLEDLEQQLTYQTARRSLKTLLFVDAVNECKKIEPMIDTLLRLAKSASDIRVLFTSTEEDPLITALTGLEPPKATILTMSAVSADIVLYIEAKLQEKKNLRRLPAETRERIKVMLIKKADGT